MFRLQNWLVCFGRIILGLAYLGSSFMKFTLWSEMVQKLASSPLKQTVSTELIPAALVFLIAAEGIGGLFLLLGYKTRSSAMLLIVTMLLSLVFIHGLWTISPAAFYKAMTGFQSDIKILGGLCFVFAYGPGIFALDRD
jgi:putative oxidoreductase